MGNKISRRRDSAAKSAETAAIEHLPAEDSAATEPAEETEITQIQESVEAEDLDVVVGEPVTLMACLLSDECVSECKEVGNPAATFTAQNDEQLKAKAVQLELSSGSEPPPKSQPVAEAQPAPETNPETVPISHQVPAPAEPLEQQTQGLNQESLLKPMVSSLPLINLGVPDLTPQPVNTPRPADPSTTPVNTDVPSDMSEESQDSGEAAEMLFETEKPEAPGFLEEPMGAAANLDQLVSDVNEDSISGLLKNLELQGNDLVGDLIPSDVTFIDDTPITELM